MLSDDGGRSFMKKLEILSIPDSKDVVKLCIAQMTSSSKISEKVKVPELELILYAPSIRGFFSQGTFYFRLFPILQKYSFIMSRIMFLSVINSPSSQWNQFS